MVFTFQTDDISFPRLPFPFLVPPFYFPPSSAFPSKMLSFSLPSVGILRLSVGFFLVNDEGLLFRSSTFSNADLFFSISGTFLPRAGIFFSSADFFSFPVVVIFPSLCMSPQPAHSILHCCESKTVFHLWMEMTRLKVFIS
jgi:hypothetical protein